jgi:hypothetical protein
VRRRSGFAGAAAALATFAVVGLLHDAGALGMQRDTSVATGGHLAMTIVFTSFGALFVAWRAVQRALERRAAVRPVRPAMRIAAQALAWCLFAHAALGMFWLAFPALAGMRRP